MNENERAVVNMLNAITIPSLDTFSDRLKLQKLVYLIREVGYDCGFTFDWYVRGPYSPSLTRTLYFADEMRELVTDQVELNEEQNDIVGRLQLLLGDRIQDPDTLELIASIWYYLPNQPMTPAEKEALIDYLIERKPNFSRNDFNTGIQTILDYQRNAHAE